MFLNFSSLLAWDLLLLFFMKSLVSAFAISCVVAVTGLSGFAEARTPPPPDIESGDPLTISAADGLNVRMQPNAQRIGAIPNGRMVYATGPARLHPTGADGLQYWVPIRYQNESNEWRQGWIYLRHATPATDAERPSDLVSSDPETGVRDTLTQPPASPADTATVDRSSPLNLTINVRTRARFRADPSFSGDILGRLTNNTAVEIIGRPQGEWIPIRVTATGQVGWVHVSLLEATGRLNPLELARQHGDTPQRADEIVEEYARTIRARDTEAGTGEPCTDCDARPSALAPLPVPADNGTYVFPLGSGHYRFSSGYGWRQHPIRRRRLFHTGYDYAAPYGRDVLAVRAGRVVTVVSNCGRRSGQRCGRGYGNSVVIDHGGGITSFYAHLSQVTVSEGAPVRQGQVIGKVGSTGLSTGNHLHLEIHRNGRHIDPSTVGVPRRR